MVFNIINTYITALISIDKTATRAKDMEIEFMLKEQKELQTLFEQISEALANAIDAKDKYTHGHSVRVAEYSREIAKLAGLSEKDCYEIYFAGLLHDIGKIGNQILSSISKAPYLSIGAHYHHERYDGRGYPSGLKGDDIPSLARIIAVADAYDAMTSKRSYRATIPQQQVREEIVKGSGTQFDPEYAGYMLHMIDLDTEYEMKEREEIVGLAGKNTLKCDEYRSDVSNGFEISPYMLTLHLMSETDADKLKKEHIPSFVIFDSLDGRYHDDDREREK